MRERDAYAPQVLDQLLASSDLSAEDAALATRLARGTLSAVGTLDEALDRFISKPGAVEPQVRDVLRIAAYELLFARTPERAAVHQGVEGVRRVRPQAAGLANAVLRRLSEAAPAFPWGDADTDVGALARLTAHPLWMVERLIADRGSGRARVVLTADNEPAPLYLAHVPFAGSADAAFDTLGDDGAEPAVGPLPGSFVAGVPSLAVRGEAVRRGLVLVTDAAAQFAPVAAAPEPGSVVVDIAAGRGTKTVLLQAAALHNGGEARIFAVDIHEFKAGVLRDRLAALGVPGVTVITADATRLTETPGLPAPTSADIALVDAPCSGLGALRRHPEKRWRVSPEQIAELSRLQGELLSSAASLVRPGGVVVYSTCSILRQENEDVVASFLAGERGEAFRVRSVAGSLPAQWRDFLTAEGYFQSYPAPNGPDGHFVAVLERM